MKLKKGSKIFYPTHGAGKIIGEKIIEFAGEEKKYLEFEFLNADIAVSSPIDKIDEIGIRPITSLKKLKKLFKKIKNNPRKKPDDDSYNKRIEHIKDLKTDNKPEDFVESLRECNYIKHFRRENKKAVPVQIKTQDKVLKNFLIGEYAMAKDLDYEKAKKEFYELTGMEE